MFVSSINVLIMSLCLIANPCMDIQCLHGGTCIAIDGEAVCECTENRSGESCQLLDPFYSQWSDFGACASTCGASVVKTRTRSCTDLSNASRTDCEGLPVETEDEVISIIGAK